jgi:hypothetical protein
MTENYPWYQIVNESALRQGDFLDSCPVLIPNGNVLEVTEGNKYQLNANIVNYNVVVMSQSCDLDNKKLDFVLVCPHWSLEDFAKQNNYFNSKEGKKQLRQGNIPGYHVLRGCEIEGQESSTCVVDFRNVYSLPFEFITNLAHQRGNRLRLLPPYREHLSQAFARFFMRVGLPVPLE